MIRMACSMICALALTLSLFPRAQSTHMRVQGTPVCGPIAANTTWTVSGSPYVLCGTYIPTVPQGVTLTIEPGVEVQFESNGELFIAGNLIANGTPTQTITFTGVTKAPGLWQGLDIYGSLASPASVSLSYVTLEYGGLSFSDSANLWASHANVTITHSLIRNGQRNGIVGGSDALFTISDTRLVNNGAHAIWLLDPVYDLPFTGLTATGNGTNGIRLGGFAYIRGQRVWKAAGIPYIITGSAGNLAGDVLTIEPGSEVQFEPNTEISIAGRLSAVGLPTAPITFTGTSKTPGSWRGLSIYGSTQTPAVANFDYVTAEYGGSGAYDGNVHINYGQAVIRRSIIRYGGSDGVYIGSRSAGTLIETSQIVSNTNYGVRNSDLRYTVLATNNWWGDPSGPKTDNTTCNPTGNGSRVTASVAFRPVLTDATAMPPTFALSDARILTLTPRRWFAPADSLTRVYVDLSLKDGNGTPLPGRQVRLQSSLGLVTDGGITDLNGKTLAYLTSSSVGDAEIVATLDGISTCESARSPSAKVTFTTPFAGTDLLPNAAAPYLATDLDVTPMPIVRGITTTIRARLTNSSTLPITADISFGFAQSGIGLTFGPIAELQGKVIPANSQVTVEVPWLPSVSGKYCLQMLYTITGIGGNAALRTNAGAGRSQRNLNVYPGPFIPPGGKNALDKAKFAGDAVDDGEFTLSALTEPAGIPTALIHDQLVGNIIDFITENGGAANCALQGGTNCGGWSGPHLKLPGDTLGNLRKDPPRQDYKIVSTPDPLTFTPLQPGPDMPAARAAAINALVRAGLDLTSVLVATVLAQDRYAGATEARDLDWASVQASAYLHYLKETSAALIVLADKLDALRAELIGEGYTDATVTATAYRAYQDRLRMQGFTPVEIQAAHTVGLPDATIEKIRQRRIALDPETVAGALFQKWADYAAALRELGNILVNPPVFQPSLSVSHGGRSRIATASSGNTLAQVFESVSTIQVGNPLTQTATIDLLVRRLDLPPDWLVSVSPAQVTLAPGEQITATVTIVPGTPTPQSTIPRVAVEGYVGSQLLGGVAVDVAVPYYMPFGLRVYLPLVQR